MKIYLSAAAILIAFVLGGARLLYSNDAAPEVIEEQSVEVPEITVVHEPVVIALKEKPKPIEVVNTAPEPASEPEMQLVHKADQKPNPPKPDYSRYWKQQEKNFNNLLDRLAKETDPKKRLSLIQALGRYIRVDTLSTLDWISTLESAEEQRIAMKTVNKHALVGIGAKIETDDTGLPLIREITIRSSVEASGVVEAGDYISGMVQPDGTMIYFEDMPLQQIVRHLRGEVGTEPTLLMMREDANGRQMRYEVTVPRSLLVVGPQTIN